MERFKKYIKRIVKLVNRDEMNILPGHLAFNIVLMVVPVFSLIGVLGSNLDLTRVLSSIENSIPNAVMEIIMAAINLNTGNFNLILFIIFTLWIASSGCRAIMSASDLLFKIKGIKGIKRYLKSFVMVLFLFILIGFIIIVPICGDFIINLLGDIFGKSVFLTKIYHALKHPISIILMFFLIKILYMISLSIKIKPKYFNNGSWFTTISWFILTKIYSFHLNNYSSYNLYYGSLSNILILLVWVYLLSYLFTIGLALNADNYLYNEKK